jgi:hypothetical protein
MKRFGVLAALAASPCLVSSSCQEPTKTGQVDLAVRSLVDLHVWDPSTEGQGQASYDTVMGWGKEAWPILIAHVADEMPTLLYDRAFDITVTLGDVCFYLLLKQMGLDWKEFFEDGARVPSLLPNRIFCIRWVEPSLLSRKRVQAHLLRLLPPPE